MEQAKEDSERLRVEVRTKPLGTTTSRQEHVFSVDAEENYIDTVMSAVYERLTSSPGEGFEGEIRINFYQAGNTSVKYGSFTRKIRSADSISADASSMLTLWVAECQSHARNGRNAQHARNGRNGNG